MATYTFNNIIGAGIGQFETTGYGKMNFPILYLDSPVEDGNSWGGNQGTSGIISAEFSTVRDKESGSATGTNYITENGGIINGAGNTTLTRSGDSYIFRLGSISITSGFSAQRRLEATAPFTILKGTNGKFTIGSGTWCGNDPVLIYQTCTIGRQGYATFIGKLIGGDSGPLSVAFRFSQSVIDAVTDWITDYTTTPSTDPYNPGGESGPGGGTGTFDGTGDDIDIPGLPTLSAADTGFITLFNPTLGQLKSLANYMWSDLFSLDTFKKMFADPMQAILGLSIVPVAVPNGGTRAVTIGNISTGVSMTVAAHQYVSVDCGTLDVQEYWGAYLDYDPYTKCYIYLPYIGTHPISTDDVMGKLVQVVYHVDILSGACTAFVKCGNSVIYQFIGQVASSIPITGDNFTNVINGVLNIAGSIGTMVATGGFSAPASVAKAGLASAYTAGHMVGAGASMAQDVMSMKPQVEKSGGLSGTGGMLSVQVPYMILERPNQAIPAKQNDFMGYPSYMTRKLSSLSGYTEVEHIHLDNVPCTELEAVEILQYLEGGVML